jgi:DNA polymerase-3 subunit gamma/tau
VSAFKGSAHADAVQRALRETLGLDVRVEGVLVEQGRGPATEARTAPAAPTGAQAGSPRAVSSAEAAASWDAPAAPSAQAAATAAASGPGSADGDDSDRATGPTGPTTPGTRSAASPGDVRPGTGAPSGAVRVPDDDEPPLAEPPDDDWHDPGPPPPPEPEAHVPSARERAMAAVRRERAEHPPVPIEEDDPSPDDPDITSSGLIGAPLVAQMLGGTVIDEQLDDQV